MWNRNLKKGTIWTVKSLNEHDDFYEGMSAGSSMILLMSVYRNPDNQIKFTYLRVKFKKRKDVSYSEIIFDNKKLYIELDTLKTGKEQALDSYINSISFYDFNRIVTEAKNNFNIKKFKEKEEVIHSLDKKDNPIKDISKNQKKIKKFGIDIFVVENDNVTLDSKNKLILSDKAKEDIIYNSSTIEDIINLCNKYQIYPIKAMKEIKYRLVYRHKQQKG